MNGVELEMNGVELEMNRVEFELKRTLKTVLTNPRESPIYVIH